VATTLATLIDASAMELQHLIFWRGRCLKRRQCTERVRSRGPDKKTVRSAILAAVHCPRQTFDLLRSVSMSSIAWRMVQIKWRRLSPFGFVRDCSTNQREASIDQPPVAVELVPKRLATNFAFRIAFGSGWSDSPFS
jgi:hypothetical protein